MDQLLKLKDRIVAKVFRILTLNIIFPLVYKIAAKKSVDNNKVVFIELRMAHLSNSFKVIFDELVSKYNFDVHTHFLLNGSGRKYQYLIRCIDMLKDIATAKYVFLNEGSNCIGSINLRKETKIAQLWHGCGAFKKFGLSTADLIFGETRKQQLRHPFNKNYSLVTISSPEVAWAYEEAMNLSDQKEIIQATGCSRTDVFYDDDFIKSAYETLYDVVPEAKGKKIILYAPTFRGRVAKATTSKMFNIKMFYDNLGDDYFVLFKHHPHAKKRPVVPQEYKNFAKDVTLEMDIEDLLCVSDICITDYSSLVFEYSLFEKPIIFFAYDLDTYFDWRGFYYDYYEMSPGPVCTTNLEMIDYIKNLDERFDKQKVIDFRYKFMRSCDGNSTKRILETLIGEQNLENHRNGCDKILQYNTVPKSDELFRDTVASNEKLLKLKQTLRNEYSKHTSFGVLKGKVIMLDCSSDLQRIIKAEYKDAIKLSSKEVLKGKKYSEFIKQIASAEYIFIEKDNKVLNLLELKNDTKVIVIPEFSFAFSKVGKSTLAYNSGLYKDYYDIAPMFNKVDLVATPSEIFGDVYADSYGVDAEKLISIGDVKADCLYNEKIKAKAMKKLKELCGDLDGKKILLEFVDRAEEFLVEPHELEEDKYLYEYLKDDYVILKIFEKTITEEMAEKYYTEPMKSYTKGMFDVTKVLTVYEAISVADVIVGAYNEKFFASFASGKPAFAYIPFARKRTRKLQTNFNYEAVLPCKMYDDPEILAKDILDVENYDFAKLNKFRETFVCNADGNAMKTLLEKLSII